MTRTVVIMMCLISFAVSSSAQSPKTKAHTANKSTAAKKKSVPTKPRPATIILKKEGTGVTGDITSISLGKLSLLIEGKIYTYRLDDVASISFESTENAEQSSSGQTNQSDVAEQSTTTTAAGAESAEADKPSSPETPASSKLTTKTKGGTLSIEAGIVYLYGGAQPVARTEFLMLDDSMEEFLKSEATLTDKDNKAIEMPSRRFLLSLIFVKASLGDNATIQKIREHTVQSVQTDFNGRATFKPVTPGRYYIYGNTAVRLRKVEG